MNPRITRMTWGIRSIGKDEPKMLAQDLQFALTVWCC